MAKGGVEGLDAPALRAEVERALGAMEDVRRIKLHLTNAAGGIESARGVLEGMAERVRAHLAAIDELVAAADTRGGVVLVTPAWSQKAALQPLLTHVRRRAPAARGRGCPRASGRRRRSACCGRTSRPGRP